MEEVSFVEEAQLPFIIPGHERTQFGYISSCDASVASNLSQVCLQKAALDEPVDFILRGMFTPALRIPCSACLPYVPRIITDLCNCCYGIRVT